MPDPDHICPSTEDHKHMPDWAYVTVTHDDGDTYIDVPCVACGQSGCVGTQKTLEDEIAW